MSIAVIDWAEVGEACYRACSVVNVCELSCLHQHKKIFACVQFSAKTFSVQVHDKLIIIIMEVKIKIENQKSIACNAVDACKCFQSIFYFHCKAMTNLSKTTVFFSLTS